MNKCAAITNRETACKGIPIDGSEYCYAHAPERLDERRRNGAKGGRRAGRGRPVADVRDIKQRLSDLADDVLEGAVDRSVGSIVAQILNVYLRAVSVEMKAKEQEELEARLEELEEALKTQNGTRRYGY